MHGQQLDGLGVTQQGPGRLSQVSGAILTAVHPTAGWWLRGGGCLEQHDNQGGLTYAQLGSSLGYHGARVVLGGLGHALPTSVRHF